MTAADPTGSYDSKEEINGCLHCFKQSCVACSKEQRLKRGLTSFDLELVEKYPVYPSDVTLSRAMNCSLYRIVRHRERLGLPDPERIPPIERERIVREKLA